MTDSKVETNCVKLTQLVDMLGVQNIKMLFQISVHSSVRYKQYRLKRLQQFCLLQTNIVCLLSIQLLFLLMTKQTTNHMGNG